MSEIKNIDIPAEIQFRGIELISSNIASSSVNIENNQAFTFEIKTEIQLSQENKFIIVIIGVQILNGAKDIQLGSLTTSNIYYIDNYDSIVTQDSNGKISIPDALITTLNSISISTTRGVMWNTFKGTFLHNAILPILDPTSINSQRAE
ncbi:hypothetical protein ACFOW1_06205 [Parasediminibacterium paludis]|uniref:Uncharacterized protein n=1 Tax=Parasediminibacterium paludis TaxID=908966 RepID=A0ABV8PWZ8_9BACT